MAFYFSALGCQWYMSVRCLLAVYWFVHYKDSLLCLYLAPAKRGCLSECFRIMLFASDYHLLGSKQWGDVVLHLCPRSFVKASGWLLLETDLWFEWMCIIQQVPPPPPIFFPQCFHWSQKSSTFLWPLRALGLWKKQEMVQTKPTCAERTKVQMMWGRGLADTQLWSS